MASIKKFIMDRGQGLEVAETNFMVAKQDFETQLGESDVDIALRGILEQINPINFQDAFDDLDGKMKMKAAHQHVIVVTRLLTLSTFHNWGFSCLEGMPYLYTGTHWVMVGPGKLKSFLTACAVKMGGVYIDAHTHRYQSDLWKQYLADAPIFNQEADKEKVLINLQNGTLEIGEDGANLRDYDKEDYLTYCLPFKYDPAADCPKFLTYLDEVLPDLSVQKVLAEALAYVFTKNLKLEKVPMLVGSGGNGKGVFYEITRALLGSDNVTTYSLRDLNQEYNRAMLKDALLNYCSDSVGDLEAGVFKMMASGEEIPARFLYANPFPLRDYAKLMFNVNELPNAAEKKNAWFRRFLIIPFTVTVAPEKRDPQLHYKIIGEELSGVLNWVLMGLDRLISQKRFSDSEAINQALEHYKTQSDNVALFLQDGDWEASTSPMYTRTDFYDKYKDYCKDNGFRSCNVKNFAARLNHCGITAKRTAKTNMVWAKQVDHDDKNDLEF